MDQPSSVWRVEKDGRHLYLAGTIHLLREKDYPLPAVFDQAYADSAKLVFELPPGTEEDGAVVAQMRQLGMYQGDEELAQYISPATMKKVLKWSASKGFPAASVKKFRPWFLALTIAATEYQALGADSSRGVDAHFEARAKADGKPGTGLETVEFQLGIFSKLNARLQENLLEQTFTESQTLPKDFEELIQAWRSGDGDKLQAFLFRDADKYPELLEEFLLKRNKAWIAPILKHLRGAETTLVLVGAGHLGGKGGVLDLLRAKGCVITQVQPVK